MFCYPQCCLGAAGTLCRHRGLHVRSAQVCHIWGHAVTALQTPCVCRPRSERLAKYNQLLRIEEELGDSAVYAGNNWRFIPWTKP